MARLHRTTAQPQIHAPRYVSLVKTVPKASCRLRHRRRHQELGAYRKQMPQQVINKTTRAHMNKYGFTGHACNAVERPRVHAPSTEGGTCTSLFLFN